MKKIIDSFAKGLAFLYRAIDKNSVLSFSEVKENSVIISFINKEIYGIKLENSSNIMYDVDMKFIFDKIKPYFNGEIFLNIIRNEKEYNVYIYSPNPKIISLFASSFKTDLMSGKELVFSFAEYYFLKSYTIKNNTLYNLITKDIEEVGINNNLFHQMAEFAAFNFLKKNDVYQAIAYKETNLKDFYSLMSFSWQGVLSLYINASDFNKEFMFKDKYKYANTYDGETAKIYKAIEENNQVKELLDKTIMANIIFAGDETSVNNISSALDIDFVRNDYDGDKIYKQTLIKYRNPAFTYFTPYEKIINLFNNTKKAQHLAYFGNAEDWLMPDFWGYDYANGFINHCFKNNTNTHCLIIGETGSGKTTGCLQTISSGMGFDDELNSELFDKGLVALRYFDVDFSAGGFINKLKYKYPNDCRIIGEEVTRMKFNILDVELNEKGTISTMDKNIIVGFLDMIIQLGKGESLKASEKNVLYKMLEKIVNKNYKNIINYSLGEIEKEEGYQKLIKELYDKGYNELTKVLELPEEYDFLKKPTLKDVVRELSLYSKDANITRIEKEATESLITKLESLVELGVFGFLSNTNYKDDKKIFYVDVSSIRKNTQMFVSIVWLMIMDLVKKDKIIKHKMVSKGKPKRKVYYVIEESHNFLGIPQFKEIFETFAMEVRKYNIHLIFLAHHATQIDKVLYKSIATKMFFFTPGSMNKVKNEIKEVDSMTTEEERVYELIGREMKGRRGIYLKHSFGVDAFEFKISPKRLEMFKQEVVE